MAKKFLASFQRLFRRAPEAPTAEECELVKRLRELMDMTVLNASGDSNEGTRKNSHAHFDEALPNGNRYGRI